MGGCYTYDYSSPCSRTSSRNGANWQSLAKKDFNKFLKSGDKEDLVKSYNRIMENKTSGVFADFAGYVGMSNISQIPNEFPEIEYEVKFDIGVAGKGNEPSVVKYLDSFDFPPAKTARFLKDPVNCFAIGTNSFYGDSNDERLVVIEKGEGIYLKEKGLVEAIDSVVPYSSIVVKRKEVRWKSTLEEALDKVSSLCNEKGVEYRGRIRKEKGDAFILDSNDGRIYSFTVTRAHLTKPNMDKESGIQRQLELEYAGYLPGFSGFSNKNENQLLSGMVDLARYTQGLYGNAPIGNGWKMDLSITNERKYDFVMGKKNSISSQKFGKLKVSGTMNTQTLIRHDK